MKRLIDILACGLKDTDGTALASGTVEFLVPGTTERKTVYTTFSFATAHSNPATLDAAGVLVAYHDGRTDMLVRASDGRLVHVFRQVGTEDADVISTNGISLIAGDGITGTSTLSVAPDGSTMELSSSALRLKLDGISTAKIASAAVTYDKMADLTVPVGTETQASSTVLTESMGTSFQQSITSIGRPIWIRLVPIGGSTQAAGNVDTSFAIKRDGTLICAMIERNPHAMGALPSYISKFDNPGVGTFTYTLFLANTSAINMKMVLIPL